MDILKLNSEGSEVANWQRFLISQGYLLDADGEFGAKTAAATRAFQASKGVRADGIVGDVTFNLAEQMQPSAIGSVKSPAPGSGTGKLDGVVPSLASKARQIVALATAEGFTLRVSQGLRTFAEQDALFRRRPVVTRARGGQSMHNYGLAVDFVFVVDGKPSWDEKLYKNIGRWVDEVGGIEWGGRWKRFIDYPHIQLAKLPPTKILLPIYQKGGLQAVWKQYGG